jgi:quinol monooxygenase YgiN
VLDDSLDQERGPVLVTLEYDIEPQHCAGFIVAMQAVRQMRQRNGAFFWSLAQDSENPRLWLEVFMDESWLEHLRHHQRVTQAERRIEAQARQYQSPDVAIRVRHLLADQRH